MEVTMKKIGKNLFYILGVLLFAGSLSLLSIKAQAKGPDEAALIAGVTKGTNYISINSAATVDGYDLNGYYVYIDGSNAVLKNCTNVKYVIISSNAKKVTVKNNTIIGPNNVGVTVIGDKATVSNNTISNMSEVAISVANISDGHISGNKVSGHKGSYPIYVEGCTNMDISKNILKDSYHYGIVVAKDNGSVIKNNEIYRSASKELSATLHGDALVVERDCKNTQIIGNTIDGVKSGLADYGNGIIVAYDSKNILVKDNTVKNCGNHGIQVTYWATKVTLEHNTVTKSGNVGISVSRDASADLINNDVFDNKNNGVVYDGHEHKSDKNYVTGTFKNNRVYNNTGNGLYIKDAYVDVTGGNGLYKNGESGIRVEGFSKGIIDGNSVYDNTFITGIHLLNTSEYTISNNKIYRTTRKDDCYGVFLDNSSKANVKSNKIHNYGMSAIYASGGTTINASGNQASVSGLSQFAWNAYWVDGNDLDGIQNQLHVNSITTSGCTGYTYWVGYRSGAQVDGKVYMTNSSSDGGKINVSFSSQSNTDKIVFFTVDNKDNSICINVPNTDFSLKGVTVDEAQVKTFVKRYYSTILGREPDDAGLEYHSGYLIRKEKTAVQVAHEFLCSPEFQDAGYDNKQFVTKLYVAFFGRDEHNIEQVGIDYWMAKLNAGVSRDEVFAGFANSPEFSDICASFGIEKGEYTIGYTPEPTPEPTPSPEPQPGLKVDPSHVDPAKLSEYVVRLYNNAMGRSCSQAEIDYYVNAIMSQEMDAAIAAKNFFFAPEYEATFGSDNEVYITKLYRTFFGREPGADEVQWYNERITNGVFTKEVTLNNFARSPEFQEILKSYGFTILE